MEDTELADGLADKHSSLNVIVVHSKNPPKNWFYEVLLKLGQQGKIIKIFDKVDVVFVKRGVRIEYFDD